MPLQKIADTAIIPELTDRIAEAIKKHPRMKAEE
jgi:hypothetical protein